MAQDASVVVDDLKDIVVIWDGELIGGGGGLNPSVKLRS